MARTHIAFAVGFSLQLKKPCRRVEEGLGSNSHSVIQQVENCCDKLLRPSISLLVVGVLTDIDV